MIEVPEEIPVTVPVEPTVATPVDTELHTPPAVASLSTVVAPTQTLSVPVMAAGVVGNGLTVTVAVAAALPQLLVIV